MPAGQPVVLVTGANGDQGREAAHRFLEGGYSVRAVVTDRTKPTARALARAGADVITGDLAERPDVRRAVAGVDVVFSVPLASSPVEQAKAANAGLLIEAAREAGVRHFIQTTVANAPEHIGFRVPGLDYCFDAYAEARIDIERRVTKAGFASWTILQPVTFMENFTTGKVEHLHPWLAEGRLDSVLSPGTRVQYVACRDIAAFAFAAAENPERFSGRTIPLAAQAITMGQIARFLGAVTGVPIAQRTLDTWQALDRGLSAGVVFSQLWCNEVGYSAPLAGRIEDTWGIPLTSFPAWAKENRHRLPL
ncbi:MULTISPECIES: NmrA family NAD(P)-binding protein [unclassified Streptomyces]|uniref:NmrA family NAD(P)-binding protein n=1 Tax=unclassified Streptomyces TaxID=2593676 RepID=UPI000F711822|nr:MULTISPECIES: NmrA family NAD(P)-binding protein [unclassified Streptomyces]AZM59425.1 NmrA family transcriptional regulator [Streptomyces sp. WAC 01438]RSM94068.1 NmrA family transcriptional regulator [Streptomyces sp. WAC 01420]